ncbi:NADAR family protein [Kribbella sp. NBC_00482]|uniref:NADAR family protein n=1 Tax=Kribbella sp. NBC_00482 TaxID=2975968 RepID=UPI002E16BBA1
MSRHEYLVHHSYGMGGFCWWVEAESPAEILTTLADVRVETDLDEVARIVADQPDLKHVRLDDLEGDGVLAGLRDRRAEDRQDSSYGVLAERLPVFLSNSTPDGKVFLHEVVAEKPDHGVPLGRRHRIIVQSPDGRHKRIVDWPIEPTFDIYSPGHAEQEIGADEFERAWRLAGSADAPRGVHDLLDGMKQDRRYRFLTFWGHTPRQEGVVDASCFSQWYPAPFVVDGITYPTAEHWMMAGKAKLFGDEAALRAVLEAPHPGAAKAAGRTVREFDEDVWRRHRFELVVDGSIHKFTAHPGLQEFLLATRSRVLVEASPVDPVWGIGLSANDDAATDPARWAGSNLLGFALMTAREHLTQLVAGQSTSTSAGAS